MPTPAFNPEISYMSLFPDTKFNNITEAYSVYGAGAFFVALMNIATDDKKVAYPAGTADDLKLSKRRSDLWTLAITQENTDKEHPCLEKVNKLLLDYLGKLTTKIDRGQIADGTQSFIPHNPNPAEIQTALQPYNVSLKDIAACFSKKGFGSDEWMLAQLNMAQTDLDVLKKELAADWTIAKINTPEKLKIVAGLDDDRLYKLIYNDIPVTKRSADLKNTFINKADAATTALSYTGNAFAATSLTAARLKRLQILHTLAVKLRWDYVTLNTVLLELDVASPVTAENLNQLARLAYLAREWSQAPEVLLRDIKTLVNLTADANKIPRTALKSLSAVASKLAVPVNTLFRFLAGHTTLPELLNELAKLQHGAGVLEKVQVKPAEYLAILLLAKTPLLDAKLFNAWHAKAVKQMEDTQSRLQPGKNENSSTDNDLERLLFEQWLHGFCVFTGADEMQVRDLFMVYFSMGVKADKIFKTANDFFRTSSDHIFFGNLLLYALLYRMLRLDAPSVEFLSHIVDTVSHTCDDASAKTFAQRAETIVQYTYVYSQIPDEKNKPAFISALKANPFSIDVFSGIMGWPDNIKTVYDKVKPDGTDTEHLVSLSRLSDCFAYAQATGIDAHDLLSHVQNLGGATFTALSPATGIPAKDSKEYPAYRAALGDRLEQDRDRLVPVALWSLYNVHNDINSPDHLSDYFLCDVDMGGMMDIAPVREATDAVQTFLLRCKAGLEHVDATSLKTITDKEWEWIPDFRIWQAEQMLRTYPENYLQPTVRSTESDLFKSMMDELQGNDLTEEKAETAMLNYLDGWMDLVSGEIVDASTYKTYSEYFGKEVETLFLVSKSRVKENTFYYNYKETFHETEAANGTSPVYRSRWSQWKEIPVVIKAGTVSSIYAFNRLHIFWSEQSTASDTDPGSGKSKTTKSSKKEEKDNTTYTESTNGKCIIYTLTIKCVYQNIDGSWSDPKTVRSFPFFLELTDSKSNLILGGLTGSYYLPFEQYFAPHHAYWKKVGVQPVKHSNGSAFIQLFCGPSWDSSNGANPVPLFCMIFNTMPVDDKLKEIQGFIYSQYAIASKLTLDGGKAFTVFGISPVLLNHSLDTVVSEDSSEAYVFGALESKYENLRPVFYKKGNAHNVQNADYSYILAENYRGTCGDTVEVFTDRHKQFTNDITKPVRKLFAVRNRVGAFYLELDNAAYIFSLFIKVASLDAISLTSKKIGTVQVCQSVFKTESYWASTYRTERIFSPAINALRVKAHENGLQSLATIKQEDDIGSPKTKFSELGCTAELSSPDSDNQLDYWGAFGIYAREFYFHLPIAISSLLSGNLKYNDAIRWLNLLLNNRATIFSSPITEPYWHYLPFQVISAKVSLDSSNLPVNDEYDILLQIYGSPSPHSIGKKSWGRPLISFRGAGQKTYILAQHKQGGKLFLISSNDLITWSNEIPVPNEIANQGDYGFQANGNWIEIYYKRTSYQCISSQDGGQNWTHDSSEVLFSAGYPSYLLNTSFEYYPYRVPRNSTSSYDPDIVAENDIAVYKRWSVLQHINLMLDFADNEFRQETWESLSLAAQLYFEAEDLLGQEPVVKDEVTAYETNSSNRTYPNLKNTATYFGTPTNIQLKALWDRVKDRLYKLRNGLNINGEKQMPSMYGSPIDPARLELAAQNGGINPYDDSQLSATLSVYRFRELAPHTESLISLVVEFGGQLYNALQQKDSEQLQVLQATHQVNMLHLVSRMYQYQLDEANKEVEALRVNLAAVEQQAVYYTNLLYEGLLPEEAGSLAANQAAKGFQETAFGVRAGAFAAHLVPTVFGFADGAFQPGSSIESAASALSEQGMSMQTLSQVLAAQAEHIRRAEEWDFQAGQAEQNKEGLLRNIEAAAMRVNIAQENMRQYQLQVSQANEVLNYFNTKFTNAELYSWMSGQMASLYFTAYQLALGSLHKLQCAYQYELDDDKANFIPSGAWNSLRKGLLAGETLKLALANMQDAYMNNNRRKQEVEKIVSLKLLLEKPGTQVNWKDCTFSLQGLCGKDQTLKIKSIAVSIPAVIGPYETFDATLKHTVTGQQITISKGIDDMGIFQEDANDGRYLPFEGIKITKQESGNWKFACEKPGISDVILTVKAWVIS
ncbi:MAG: hypothetical protein FD123_4266 [Bacteroidetes bacterium]|nr:MAG: hypothetical protein FD123_4266 [Bacteroidota bacterium]